MADKVKGAYQRTGDLRMGQAMNEAWTRLHKKLEQLLDRLTDDVDGERKRFSNGLMESAHELVDVLQYLNVNNDFELEQARLALRDALRGLSTEQVKNSVVARTSVANAVQQVQSKFAMLQL
jgi:signal transduction protein with GAF and PtsI domain